MSKVTLGQSITLEGEELEELRRNHPDDEDFRRALFEVAHEILTQSSDIKIQDTSEDLLFLYY